MKYIEAVKLRAGIESIHLFPQISADYNDGREDMKTMVLDTIDSLQQEQPEVDLGADIEMEWDSFNKHVAEYGEEVVWLNWLSFVDIARHFYELGKNSK